MAWQNDSVPDGIEDDPSLQPQGGTSHFREIHVQSAFCIPFVICYSGL